MAIATITLTGNVHDAVGADVDTRRASAWIVPCDANGPIQRIVDPESNEERYGNARATINADGSYAFTNLWPTNVATNPTGFYYEVFIEYVLKRGGRHSHGSHGNGNRDLWRSGAFALVGSGTVAMADLDFDTPAVSATWRSEFRTDMEAIRSEVRDISNIDTTDEAVAALATLPGGVARDAFARKRTVDARDYGVTGNGTTDDTAALQAAVNAAGADNLLGGHRPVELFNGTFRISSPIVLPKGACVQGVSPKSTIIFTGNNDIPAFYSESGQGEVIRDLKIRNGLNTAGSRTTYDIEFVNPTKPLIENVEIDLPSADTGAGGIRFSRDSTKPGNAYMPQLKGVWIRNGHMISRGVSDGHFVEGWVWSPNSSQPGSVRMYFHDGNSSDGWTFTSVDVGGTNTFGAGYHLTSVNHTKIIGGYLDGHIGTFGLRAINSGRIFVAGFNFYQCGYSAVRLENTHGCVFSSVGFYKNNRAGTGSPDIELIGSDFNTFQGTNHGQPTVHTTRGVIYREDAGSNNNLFENSVIDVTLGNEYATPLFVGNPETLGRNNRPLNLWPSANGAPDIIAPPASLLSIPAATAWPVANMAILHRFTVTHGGVYRWARFRLDSASGNMHTAIVKLSGTHLTNFTRVATSGVVTAGTGGDRVLDMGPDAYLEPGEYALALWFDNTTATVRVNNNTGIPATRLTATWTATGGIPASGTLSGWGSSYAVGGLTVGRSANPA